jgi:putative tryptophan/tyrosine transport system substrate-binding protein
MRRREFLALWLGGAAFAWPLNLNAQSTKMPVVGWLFGGSRAFDLEAAFKQGLKEIGFSEGKNVRIEYRSANNQYDQLPVITAELVKQNVDVIAVGTPVAALAAKAATRSIPIVFGLGSDPVKDGLVTSLSRPGGNITGATFFGNLLPAKRTELLHGLVPNAKVFALLLNPRNANAELEINETQKAVHALGLQLVLLDAINEAEIEKCFATATESHVDAVVITGDALFYSHQELIVEWAKRNRVPTSFAYRQQVISGGLMSYGASPNDTFRKVGTYVGRILMGERPADLPVLQPTAFELVINLKTAKTLGIDVPPSLLAIADEVVE